MQFLVHPILVGQALLPLVPALNVSKRKVGGIWFVKLGRVNFSFSVSRRDGAKRKRKAKALIPFAEQWGGMTEKEFELEMASLLRDCRTQQREAHDKA